MLSGTPDHPKFLALRARLNLPKPHVAGLLEFLWLFTAAYAPAGDVGRWPDEAIEAACSWEGARGELVAALVEAGWLDQDSSSRLVVHDWSDHQPRYIRRRMAYRRKTDDTSSAPIGTPSSPNGQPSSPNGRPLGRPTQPNPTQPNPTQPERITNSRPAAPVVPLPKPSPVWSREACDDWISRFGGTAPGGVIGKSLKPLVEKHGWPKVRGVWRRYLAQADARFADATRFAATFGDWSSDTPPVTRTGPKDPRAVIDNNRAVLGAFVKRGE